MQLKKLSYLYNYTDYPDPIKPPQEVFFKRDISSSTFSITELKLIETFNLTSKKFRSDATEACALLKTMLTGNARSLVFPILECEEEQARYQLIVALQLMKITYGENNRAEIKSNLLEEMNNLPQITSYSQVQQLLDDMSYLCEQSNDLGQQYSFSDGDLRSFLEEKLSHESFQNITLLIRTVPDLRYASFNRLKNYILEASRNKREHINSTIQQANSSSSSSSNSGVNLQDLRTMTNLREKGITIVCKI